MCYSKYMTKATCAGTLESFWLNFNILLTLETIYAVRKETSDKVDVVMKRFHLQRVALKSNSHYIFYCALSV